MVGARGERPSTMASRWGRSTAEWTLTGYRSRGQGHHAEQYVRALASASGLSVGKSDPVPVCICLYLVEESVDSSLGTLESLSAISPDGCGLLSPPTT